MRNRRVAYSFLAIIAIASSIRSGGSLLLMNPSAQRPCIRRKLTASPFLPTLLISFNSLAHNLRHSRGAVVADNRA